VKERKIAIEDGKYLITEPGAGVKEYASLECLLHAADDANTPVALQFLSEGDEHSYVNDRNDTFKGFGTEGEVHDANAASDEGTKSYVNQAVIDQVANRARPGAQPTHASDVSGGDSDDGDDYVNMDDGTIDSAVKQIRPRCT